MAINPGFLGHGIFLELNPIDGLRRYANYKTPLPPHPSTAALVDKFIEAITDMKMSSVWFELFSRHGELDTNGEQGTRELVDGLKSAHINPVAWGYCLGANSQKPNKQDNDLQLAIDLCDKYQLDNFVANVEPGNTINGVADTWDAGALAALIGGLNAHFGQDNIGISSFANLQKQPTARGLLAPVASQVAICAPQIYWNNRDPVDWAQQSLQSWKDAGITTALVATVQSYWELDENTPPEAAMEAKVEDFIRRFPAGGWSGIVGLNWYHAGGANTAAEGGMTDGMIAAIVAGRLDQKPYKQIAPSAGQAIS